MLSSRFAPKSLQVTRNCIDFLQIILIISADNKKETTC